jgi:outer membrane receptor protein involved in Fe transport
MRKKLFVSLLLSLTAMAFAVSAFAQVTTAALGGRVTDASGESVPGAAVIAVHQPSGSQYYGLTNAEGRYNITGMRSGGPYTVEISCMGYRKVSYTDVTLQLAEVYSLNAKLDDDKMLLEEAIVISTATSKFAQEKTGASTNVSQEEILTLPSASRSITDVAKLSPYGGNDMSFGGGDGRSTNFTIDGANFNNNFGLSDKLPGGGMPVSLDAIEEVQIVVSPFDVRQSNFIGGGVNAITKSGTNTFKGTAYVYHQNAKLRGKTIEGSDELQGTPSNSTVYGATIGGPIIKNKLFFFISGEYSGDTREASYANWRPSVDGVADDKKGLSRTTQSDMDLVAKYLKDNYGYETGGYTNYDRPFSNLKLLGRIDWNINQDHHLALRYNYTKNQSWTGTNGNSGNFDDPVLMEKLGETEGKGYRHNNLNRISQYSMAFANSIYSTENNVWSISLDLNSRLGDNLSNQFLATYSNIEDVRGSDSAKFPFIDIMKPYTNDKGETLPLYPYISAGYELFTWYNGVHNRVLNVKDDLTFYAGSHKLMAGASVEYQFADNAYMREGAGYYRFSSLDDFLNGEAPETVALTYGYGGNETPSARIQFTQLGLYAQDEWNVADNFKLTAGIRFDTILYDNNDLMKNQAVYDLAFGEKGDIHIDTGKWPATNVQISPRLGFTWDVFDNKVLKLRGGTGLFAGRMPLVYMTNMPTNAAMFQHLSVIGTAYNKDQTLKDRNPNLDAFAAKNNGGKLITSTADILKKMNELDPAHNPLDISPKDGQLQSPINGVDPNFKMPQVWKSSLAIDFQVPTPFPWTITAEGIFNKTINGTLIKNWNTRDNASWSRFTGPDNRHVYPSGANQGYTSTPAYVLTNTNKGYGWIVNVNTNIEPVKNLKLMASYTHTVQKEVTGMPGNDAGSVFTGLYTVEGPNFAVLQNSRYVNPDRIIASVSYKLPTRTLLSMFYEAYVPTGYSFSYANDMNGDGINTDLIYIPKDQNEILFASEGDKTAFWSFVEQDKYLSAHKGSYAEAYSAHAPMTHKFDFRLTQDIRFRIGSTTQTIQLNADLMNFTNLFNDSWGVGYTIDKSAENGQVLVFDKVNAGGQPIFKSNVGEGAKTWSLSHSAFQTWYLQLGIKYMFN